MIEQIKILAFTHKLTDINDIGKLHIEEGELKERLNFLKSAANLKELFYLSTCNRVEFLIINEEEIDDNFLKKFFNAFNPDWNNEDIKWAVNCAQQFQGVKALNHMFSVASSIDSLVVGEREIITQVRTAYETCNKLELTGDLIRIIVKKTIEVAKEVYTETAIAHNPVSVVSLAYRKLRALNVQQSARFLIVGAGVTNASMAKYLKKHEYANFTVFNRTLKNAQTLADELHGEAFTLNELSSYNKGFDIIVTCTGASESIITPAIYKNLVGNDTSKKVVIDLAIPNDLDAEILDNYDVNLIAINNLQAIAKENLQSREKELERCYTIINKNIEEFKAIVKERSIELAMQEVPKKVKEIRVAAHDVFAKELTDMDDTSKELLDKVISYMEKKYISVPMKMAREIFIENAKK